MLVVEDNKINQKVMEWFLGRWGIDITVANNGQEGIEKVKEQQFDLILMDLQTPMMDGYEAPRQIRMMDVASKRNIPIIALTAALKEVKEKVYATGMNDFITKPFNPSYLRNKLERYILKENA